MISSAANTLPPRLSRCEFPEDGVPRRVQIKDPVDHGNIDLSVGDGQLFSVCFSQFKINYASLGCSLSSSAQHYLC